MLTARNAQLAVKSMYARVGVNITVSNAEPFQQGYDNYTGGPAGIGNFNNLFVAGGGAGYTRIFYGCATWGMTNDNIGLANYAIYTRYYHDLAGFSYAFTLNVVAQMDSAITFFDYRAGTTQPIFVQQCGFAGKSQIDFDGYIFDIH